MRKFTQHLVYPFMLILMSGTMQHALAAKPTGVSNTAFSNATRYTWYNGDRANTIWLNPRLIAEFDPRPSNHAQSKALAANATRVQGRRGALQLWRPTTNIRGKSDMQAIRRAIPTGRISPVLHDGPSAAASKRALPGNIIVHLDPDWDAQQVKTWFKQQALEMLKPLHIGKNIFVVKTDSGLAALEKANEIYLSGKVVAAYPNWWREVHKK